MLELGGVGLVLVVAFGALWFLMARRVRKLERRLSEADDRNLSLVKSTRDMALRSGCYPRQSPALAPDVRRSEPPPLPVLTEVIPDNFILARRTGAWKLPRYKMPEDQ